MRYLLDSNTCIQYINGRSPRVADKLDTLPKNEVVICSIVKGELFFGALRSQNPRKTMNGQRQFLDLFVSLPFDDTCADEYAKIRATLSSKGQLIGSNDMLIAAIALANNLVLVTHNVREFERVENLKIEDWET